MENKISPKKFSKKPYAPFKQREKVPFKQRVNVFADNQKKKIVKSFEGIVNKIKPHVVMSANYKQFVNKVNNPVNRKIIKLLPVILLSITVLAVKNKRLIKPMIDAYQITSGVPGSSSVADRAVLIAREYSKFFSSMNAIESLELALSTLSFFLEDIPAVFDRLDTQHGLSQLTVQKNIFRNVADLKKDFLDKPRKEKKEREQQQEQKKQQQALKKDQQELQRNIQQFLAKVNKEDTHVQKNAQPAAQGGVSKKSSKKSSPPPVKKT